MGDPMQLQLQPESRQAETPTPCPKCGTIMLLAAVTRHPLAANMHRHTYLCTTCNQTKTYVLPAPN
jgi:hypothetical protein